MPPGSPSLACKLSGMSSSLQIVAVLTSRSYISEMRLDKRFGVDYYASEIICWRFHMNDAGHADIHSGQVPWRVCTPSAIDADGCWATQCSSVCLLKSDGVSFISDLKIVRKIADKKNWLKKSLQSIFSAFRTLFIFCTGMLCHISAADCPVSNHYF